MKKKKITISLSILLMMFFVMRTCVSGKKEPVQDLSTKSNQFVAPPFPNMDIPRNYFELDLSKDTVIKFGSTTINIPSCAFIDSNKQVIKGKIRMSYREVNSPQAILISGVPMRLTENGDKTLESAGMFELLVNQNNQALFPNPDCSIQIGMKSKKKGKDYNLYSLDTVARQWKETQSNIPVIEEKIKKEKSPNFEKMALQKGIINPVKPELENKNLYQFKFKMDFSKYPELNIYNGVEWEFVGRKKSENPEKNPWVKTAYWNEMEIVKRKRNGVYKLKLTSKGRVFTTTVKPVFKADDMEYASFVFNEKYAKYRSFIQAKKEQIAKAKAQMEKINNRNATIGLVKRSFALQGFGWTNIDRILKQEQITLALGFQNKKGETINASRVFLMMEGINSVVTYSTRQLDRFKYGKNKKCKLVIIDENAIVYKVSTKEFGKLSETAKKHSFTLKKTYDIDSEKDLFSMIGKPK